MYYCCFKHKAFGFLWTSDPVFAHMLFMQFNDDLTYDGVMPMIFRCEYNTVDNLSFDNFMHIKCDLYDYWIMYPKSWSLKLIQQINTSIKKVTDLIRKQNENT